MSAAQPGAAARLLVLLQALLPTRLLSRVVHALAHVRARPVKNALIRIFVTRFGVDMREAAEPDATAYPHFNAFFTRALAPGARPLPEDAHTVASPVDGTMSELGAIDGTTLIQAKGSHYDAAGLIGEDAGDFRDGRFCTIYLAPWNYHRIHAPAPLSLTAWRHIPGRLFSVNPVTVSARPRLFARNERVVALFDCAGGRLAVVMVGALLVGSVDTVWAGRVTPPHRRRPSPAIPARGRYAVGEEIGRFNMGSTVILLATPGLLEWSGGLGPGAPLRMGQAIGTLGGAEPSAAAGRPSGHDIARS
ncbi:archaetidylserine decarboxylase [Algiphilus sp.]|uniref:archaetidylserine decarboxylase n=1 Tax=Algiphilus sp. TaxID=1872431 RepID=UPI0025C0559D|nr:archaetidylserine decarboxylase [Algiphilus sp.]MCK5770278.1 phosphatidylserine decarboxylase [Algiphilus sp.]